MIDFKRRSNLRDAAGRFVMVLVLGVLPLGFARESEAKPEAGVWGVIHADLSTVYSAPNFDGKILANLPAKSRVVMSRSSYGDQGPQFYKVKIKIAGKSVIGYVLDSEIGSEKPGVLIPRSKADGTLAPNGSNKAGAKSGPKPDQKADQKADQKNDSKSQSKADLKSKKDVSRDSMVAKNKKHKRKKEKQPMLFSTYAGVVAGLTDFKEKISGIKAEENMLTYGIKLTGPDLLFKGPITEFNFMIHSGAPSYYNALSGIKPTGFIIWTDALLVYPFFNRDNAMVSFNAGPLFVLSDFKVLRNDKLEELFAINAGLSAVLSGAYRIGSVALRLEVKYMFENKSYLAYLGSVQSEF